MNFIVSLQVYKDTALPNTVPYIYLVPRLFLTVASRELLGSTVANSVYIYIILNILSVGRIQIVTTVMWLGLSDISIEGNWEWSDESPLTYLNWREGTFTITTFNILYFRMTAGIAMRLSGDARPKNIIRLVPPTCAVC